jgi:hypothetical protein
MAVITVKVVAEAPRWGQGDTEANPIPAPRATNIRLVAIAVIAPAKMAGHEAADTTDSFGCNPLAIAGTAWSE